MRKPELTWGKVGLVAAVAAGAGTIALLATGEDEQEPIITNHFVDCAIYPDATVSKTVHPGEKGLARMGEAYQEDGKIVWRSLFEVAYEPDKFTIIADGYSPPGGQIRYDEIPHGDHNHDAFVDNIVYPGYIDASVTDFDANDPLNPKNAVTITFHCGAPPPISPPVESGPETSMGRAVIF